MDKIKARWVGGRAFVASDVAGHGLVMDSPAAYGGEGIGARPLEVVLYGLAGCTGMDVVSILEKQRQEFTAVEIAIEGVQREEQPRIYTSIRMIYTVRGRNLNAEQVNRAVQLSQEKYCSVRGMFGPDVVVTHEVVVTEEAASE